MTIFPADIANRALVLAGFAGTIGDLQEGSMEAQVAIQHYTQSVWALLRQKDYEFSRKVATLTLSGNTAAPGWTYEYLYPSDCIRMRTITPAAWDQNDPQPLRWSVGTAVVSGQEQTVIWSNLASAKAVYTTNLVTEDNWDPLFTEAVVQYLATSFKASLSKAQAEGRGVPEGKEPYETAVKVAQTDTDRDS